MTKKNAVYTNQEFEKANEYVLALLGKNAAAKMSKRDRKAERAERAATERRAAAAAERDNA